MPTRRNNKTYLALWAQDGLYKWLDARRKRNGSSLSREVLSLLMPIWHAEKEKKSKRPE